ncbi:MAG TPA: ABC transporter permease, partial [Longimicrobiales bacterium]|nr:ABC transporter permease [Longimicrobiales bacterium]
MPASTTLGQAARQLLRNPRYSVVCVAALALAVATATATLALVRRAWVDALPYRAGDELVALFTESETWDTSPVSVHVLEEMRAGPVSLEDYTSLRPRGLAHTQDGITTQRLGVAATDEFFATLAMPAAGRAWSPGEADVVIISWKFWQDALGGRPDVLGHTLTLDGGVHTVIGVLPAAFVMPWWYDLDVLLPLDVQPLLAEPRARRQLSIVARRTAAPAALEAELAQFTERVQRAYPDAHTRQRFVAQPLRDAMIGPARPALLGTAVASLLLLLIAGANIASLAAVRALTLRQQVRVQAALGATHLRLLRERILESVLLAGAGSALGLWLGWIVVGVMAAMQAQFLGRMAPVTLDAGTAALGGAAGLAVGTLAGVLPWAGVLARTVRGPGSARGATITRELATARSTLVVVQVALALVLLVGAGLLVRTVHHRSTVALGFTTDRIATVSVGMPGERYASDDAQVAFERDAIAALERVPGVEAVTASVGVPVIGGTRAGLIVRGRVETAPVEVAYFSVAPGFMDALDIPLRAGRNIAPYDIADTEPVMVISETLAARLWPDGDAIGARIHVGPGTPPDDESWMSVVGIVADVRQHGPAEAVLPTAYGSTHQFSWPRRNFVIRIREGAVLPREDVRAAIAALDASVPVGTVQLMDELTGERIAQHRVVMIALAFFGTVALLLCALGLYAVTSHASRMRRREYAIRMAIGAAPASVHALVLREGL